MKSLITLGLLFSVFTTVAHAETYRCFWKADHQYREVMGDIRISEDSNGVETADLIDWGADERTHAVTLANLPVKRVLNQIIIDYERNHFTDSTIILKKEWSGKKLSYNFGFVEHDRKDFCKLIRK